MKKTPLSSNFLILCILLLPVGFAAYLYPSLPETIPTHFDIIGKADRFGPKQSIWFITLFLSGISGGVYLLLKNLHRIDPKKTAGQSPQLLNKIAVAQLVFICALNLLVLYASKEGSFGLHGLMLPLLGIFFMVLGNYMHSIKPNYFVGFRTPWTLENEDNWRKTHQLVGKIWVPGGLLISISTLVLPIKAGFIVFMSLIGLMVLVPLLYSYWYFTKNRLSGKARPK